MSTLAKITQWFKSLNSNNATRNLDTYITSKRPTTAAEVDYWIKRYDQTMKGTYL